MQISGLDGIIETPRLQLRGATINDASALAALRAEADIPWKVAQETRAFLIEGQAGPVGCIGLTPDGRWPELGLWIAKAHRGQGFATEATLAALEWAERQWGQKAVAAGHFAADPALGAVFEKAGFLDTGDVELRPSLVRPDPAPARMMVWLA